MQFKYHARAELSLFHHWFSFLLLMAFLYFKFKLVAKNNCYAILSARLRMYACSAYEPRPHEFVDLYCTAVIIYIWQAQNGDPIAFRSSKTPYRY